MLIGISSVTYYVCVIIIVLILVMLIYRICTKRFTNFTFLAHQIQMFSNTPQPESSSSDSPDICIHPYDDIDLSVLYNCPADIQVAREQIVCLIQLITSSLGSDASFEIIILIPMELSYLAPKVNNLILKLGCCRAYISDSDGIVPLLVGAIRARGQYVVDARYLHLFIDDLFDWKTPTIVMNIPPIENDNPSKYMHPIAMTKNVVPTVLTSVHCTRIGFSKEITLLSELLKVKLIRFQNGYGDKRVYLSERILTTLSDSITKFLYSKKIWQPVVYN